jgi:hypothetical protein
MKVYIKNEVSLQNELITIKEDAWAYVYALASLGTIGLWFGALFAAFRY